jgi:ribonuclease D
MPEAPPDNKYGLISAMTRDEIYSLPLKHFGGDIRLIETVRDFERSLPLLYTSRIYGFDTETKPSFKKGVRNKVSLLQLANHSMALLIRVSRINLPPELLKFLGDEKILKIGVAIRDDLASLNKLKAFKPAGFIELQSYVKEFGIEAKGLRELSAIALGFRISKAQQVTNWDSDKLTENQLIYAATDAWVCYQIYSRLRALKINSY